jgi:DNA-binding HxlR family transcriptional regulator
MANRIKPMARRTYGDSCGIARALDVVGERWALLVVRELLLGPKRFTDLRAGLPNLGPDVLSQRLRDLEAAGVVRKRTLEPPAGSRVYELTEWGHELEPVLNELGRWGSTAPFPDGPPPLGVDSAVLALRSLFDRSAAQGLEEEYELRLDGQRFRARVSRGKLDVARGGADDPATTIVTDTATFAALLWQGTKIADAIEAGDAEVEGSRRAAARFLRLFPLPR